MGPSRFGELDTCRVGGVERWRFELAGLVFVFMRNLFLVILLFIEGKETRSNFQFCMQEVWDLLSRFYCLNLP